MSIQNKIKLDGGEFILKDISPDEVFSPEDFSEEQKMIKDTVIEFIDREIWPRRASKGPDLIGLVFLSDKRGCMCIRLTEKIK